MRFAAIILCSVTLFVIGCGAEESELLGNWKIESIRHGDFPIYKRGESLVLEQHESIIRQADSESELPADPAEDSSSLQMSIALEPEINRHRSKQFLILRSDHTFLANTELLRIDKPGSVLEIDSGDWSYIRDDKAIVFTAGGLMLTCDLEVSQHRLKLMLASITNAPDFPKGKTFDLRSARQEYVFLRQ